MGVTDVYCYIYHHVSKSWCTQTRAQMSLKLLLAALGGLHREKWQKVHWVVSHHTWNRHCDKEQFALCHPSHTHIEVTFRTWTSICITDVTIGTLGVVASHLKSALWQRAICSLSPKSHLYWSYFSNLSIHAGKNAAYMMSFWCKVQGLKAIWTWNFRFQMQDVKMCILGQILHWDCR